MSQKRNALGIQWKKKWLMICGRNQWRGDNKGIVLGIMLGDNRRGDLLTRLEE